MKTATYKFNFAGLLMVVFLLIAGHSQSQSNCIPDSLTATNITTHSVKLSWEGIQGPTHVRYYPTGTTDYEVRETHMNHLCLHNLTANTPYSWDLSNLCNGEWTPYSGNGSFTTLADTIPPPPPPTCIPTDLTATNVTEHSASLDWAGIQGATWVRYYPTGDTIYKYAFAHQSNITLHRLAPETAYSWDLNNFCNGQWTGYLGNGSFTTLADTIPPPPPPTCIPTDLADSLVTATTVFLTWGGIFGPTHVRYYPTGTTDYEIRETHMNHISLCNLLPNTSYSWDLSNLCNGEWTPYLGDGSFTTITGLDITGINNADGKGLTNLSVYPNPMREKASVSFTSSDNGSFVIKIFDITGRELTTLSNQATNGITTFELDLSGNPKGIYFLRLQQGSEIKNIKLIKE